MRVSCKNTEILCMMGLLMLSLFHVLLCKSGNRNRHHVWYTERLFPVKVCFGHFPLITRGKIWTSIGKNVSFVPSSAVWFLSACSSSQPERSETLTSSHFHMVCSEVKSECVSNQNVSVSLKLTPFCRNSIQHQKARCDQNQQDHTIRSINISDFS